MKPRCTNNDAEVMCVARTLWFPVECSVVMLLKVKVWVLRKREIKYWMSPARSAVSMLSSVFIACIIPHNLSLCLNPYILFIHLRSFWGQRHGLKTCFYLAFVCFWGWSSSVSLNSCKLSNKLGLNMWGCTVRYLYYSKIVLFCNDLNLACGQCLHRSSMLSFKAHPPSL